LYGFESIIILTTKIVGVVKTPFGGNQKIVWIKTTGFYTNCFLRMDTPSPRKIVWQLITPEGIEGFN
jgi:hypothetical protein